MACPLFSITIYFAKVEHLGKGPLHLCLERTAEDDAVNMTCSSFSKWANGLSISLRSGLGCRLSMLKSVLCTFTGKWVNDKFIFLRGTVLRGVMASPLFSIAIISRRVSTLERVLCTLAWKQCREVVQ